MIESITNTTYKHYKRLLESAAYRKKQQAFILETPKVIDEFYVNFANNIQSIVVLPDAIIPNFLYTYPQKKISRSLMKSLSSMESFPDYMVCCKNVVESCNLVPGKKYVYLDGVQDPANLGAIIRNVKAFEFDGLLLSESCVDIYHPKTIRSMVGAGFNQPFLRSAEDAISTLRELQYRFILLDEKSDVLLSQCPKTDSMVFVFGSEGQGLSSLWRDYSEIECIRIPMSSQLDSLNVSVTAGLVLYHFSDFY